MLHEIQAHLCAHPVMAKTDAPLVSTSNVQNTTVQGTNMSEPQVTLLQEIHHQVLAEHSNSYRFNELKRRVSEVEGNPREKAPMVINLDKMLVMWDLPSDV